MKKGHQAKGSEGKRKHHTRHGHGKCLSTHGHQFFELTFQTRQEQKGVEPEIGDGPQRSEALVVNG